MSSVRSNRIFIVILAVAVVALIAGGVYVAQNALGPVEARTNPTAQIAVMPPSDGRTPTVEIRFDQRMDRTSVERAIQVVPAFEYSVVWDTAITADRVVITPAAPLAWDAEFMVSVGAGATNNRGLPLTALVNVAFSTPRTVNIVNVYPAANAEEVAPTEVITVQFDQAVIDTAALNKDASAPQPIQIEPIVQGTGQWMAPDTYSFYPTSGLTSGTDYRVRINSQVAPDLALAEPYAWSFATSGPRLTASYPFDGATDVERATAITLLFTQPMDRESVEQNFLLSTNGEEVPVAGEFAWDDDRHLIFRPTEALEVNTDYSLAVDAGAKPQGGTNGLQSPYRATFTTVDFLAVESVQPAPGSTEVTIAPTDTVISVQFNHPVVPVVGLTEKDDLPSPIVIAPRLAGEGEWVTTSLFVFRPTEPLLPSTEYAVTIPQGVEDTLGAYLAESYAWSFTSEYPRVLRLEPTNQNNYINPAGPIGVRFNQPMDPASTEAAFTLRVTDGESVAGTFAWEDDNALLQFTPDTALERGAFYTIEVAEGANGQLGGETFELFQTNVETPSVAGVVSTEPVNGASAAPRGAGIRLTFNSPMDPTIIDDYITITPTATKFYTGYDPISFTFYYYPQSFGFLPAETDYTVLVDGDLPDESGQVLGEDYEFGFTTEMALPVLELAQDYGRIGTYNPYTGTIQVIRHRNIEQIDLTLYALSKTELLQALDDKGFSFIDEYDGGLASVVAQWTEAVEKSPNVAPLRVTVPTEGDGQPSGAYLLRATSPTVVTGNPNQPTISPRSTMVYVYTPINLTTKRTPTGILVWATDIQTGEPVEGANIEIYNDGESTIATGTTDSDGLFSFTPDDPTDLGYIYNRVVVLAVDGDTILGATNTQQQRDLYVSQWNVDSNLTPPTVYGTVYPERPIYRPGQTVYFRGIVRQVDGMSLELPELTQPLTMVVSANGTGIDTQSFTLSPYGTFEGEITLDEEAPTGWYNFYAEIAELRYCYGPEDFTCVTPGISGSFQVAEYVRPEYEVLVAPSQETVVQGDVLSATVSANYYFGGTVPNAPFNYRVLARPYYFTSDLFPGYWSWGDYDSYRPFNSYYGAYDNMRIITTGEGTLDGNGNATVSVPTDNITVQADQPPFSQEVSVEADVHDVNDKTVTGRSRFVVHAGEFYIGLQSAEYFAQVGRPFTLNVATADPTGAIVGGKEVTLELYQRQYITVREEQSDGSAIFTTTFTDTLESSQNATTNEEGMGNAALTPEQGGSYTIVATATDAQGNEIRSRYYLWVADEETSILWGDSAKNGMQLRTDKATYEVGDVAQVLVPTPLDGMTALVTLEQNGIISTEVRTLDTTAEIIEVPITEDMIPNVYIAVVALKGAEDLDGIPEFRLGVARLQVEPTEKLLTVTLTPQTDDPNMSVQPGDEATYDIKVTDHEGNPVETELSLAVVDKATLALATSEFQAAALRDVFYSVRPLAVSTASDLAVNLNRLIRALDPIIDGGGGGGGGGFASELQTREDMPDTAFWRADIVTDENGEASVAFTLPDNLTTWVLTARGISREGSLVGEEVAELLSTKPLIVRPTLPRFAIQGDQMLLRFVVNNNTDEPLEGTFSFIADGVTIADDTDVTSDLRLTARGQTVIEVPVTVDNVDAITFTASASAGIYADVVRQTVHVYPATAPETVATGGVIRAGEGGAVETIRLPEGVELSQGNLTIEVAPSLAGATDTSRTFLDSYGYATNEAVASQLLANLSTLRTKSLLEQPTNEAVENAIVDQVSFLQEQQRADGGWTWWYKEGDSQPWLSAYVVLALQTAADDGYSVSDTVISRGVTYLNRYLVRTATRQDDVIFDTRAFVFYVLSEVGEAELDDMLALFDDRSFLDPDAKAYLLLALDNTGESQRTQVQTLAAELTANARLSATGAHWEDPALDATAFDSTIRTSAVVLRALVRVEPEHMLIPQSVRWLVNARQDEWWESPNTTAWVLWSLTDYMVTSGELEADFAYEVALNDDVILSEQATPATITDLHTLRIAIADLLLDQDNRLIVTPQPPSDNTMQGRLYYNAWLRYSLPVDEMPARFEGIDVERVYEAANTQTFLSTGSPVTEVAAGDVVLVRVTINAPNQLYYFTLEDPIPAGFEVIDPSLATNSEAGTNPDVDRLDANKGAFWFDGWSQTVIRDEKVALFSDILPRGTYEYTYLLRAIVPGTYSLLPTHAYEQYHPEVFGRTAGEIITVTP